MSIKFFSGRGQFGSKGPTTDSVWNNATLAEDLHLARETELPGTTIGIVGFHNPASPTDGVESMAAAVRAAWAKWFWPALHDGTIAVDVEMAVNRTAPEGGPVRAEDARLFFVDALERYRRQETVDELSEPGDVIVQDVVLRIPRRRDGSHGEVEHNARLVVRLAEEGDDYSNQVALFRRPGMVVEHIPVPEPQTGGIPFHGFVLCGEAVGDSPEDKAAEAFLRAAEPPAHDRWDRTDDLPVLYMQGGVQALKDFKDRIRGAIRHLFAQQSVDSDEGPDALKRLLRISGPNPVPDKPHVKELTGRVVDGRWEVETEISMINRDEGWSFEPVIEFVGESRNERVRWETLEAARNCEVVNGRVVVRKKGRSKTLTAALRGTSDAGRQLIPAERAAVTLAISNVRRAEVGE